MKLQIYNCSPKQARLLADFCLHWNCTTLTVFNYDPHLHQAAKDVLEPWAEGGSKAFPERVFSIERLDTVAQLITIFFGKQQRKRYSPFLNINSGRVSTIHNFRLSVRENSIEINFANIYHAQMLNAIDLDCYVEVTSLDSTKLTETKRFERVTAALCEIGWPAEIEPSPEVFDFDRWPHAASTFDRYTPPGPSDASILEWWTPIHDSLLRQSIEQHGWRWRPPLQEILAITPAEHIVSLEAEGSHRVLEHFCNRRGLQEESCVAAFPPLAWVRCCICKQYFHQRTVVRFRPLKFAIVCSVCHREANPFGGTDDHEWTRTQVLDHIRALYAASGGRFDLPQPVPETLAPDQYVALIRLWKFQPPRTLIRQLFGSLFAARVEAGVIPDAWVRMSRGTRCLARDGHTCLSLGEKAVCDWLFDNRVPHRREVPYGIGCNYIADWEIAGQLVEYFGLTGDERYDSKMQKKKEFAEKHGLPLLALYPQDLDNLGKVFAQFGIVPSASEL